LRPQTSVRNVDIKAAIQAVKDEMHPYDKNLFRSGEKLRRSRENLDEVWREIRQHAGGDAQNLLVSREAAALVASARWSLTAALARDESRGMHQREDRPDMKSSLARRIVIGGLDTIRTDASQADASGRALETVA